MGVWGSNMRGCNTCFVGIMCRLKNVRFPTLRCSPEALPGKYLSLGTVWPFPFEDFLWELENLFLLRPSATRPPAFILETLCLTSSLTTLMSHTPFSITFSLGFHPSARSYFLLLHTHWLCCLPKVQVCLIPMNDFSSFYQLFPDSNDF